MAEGFAAGLAGGLAQGAQLAQAQAARQQEQERINAQEQNYESLAQSRIAAQNRQASADTRAAQSQQFKDLSGLASQAQTAYQAKLSAYGQNDPRTQQALQALNGVQSQLHNIYTSSPIVQNAQASRQNARQNAASLASGQTTLAELPPNDLNEVLSHGLGVPAQTVLRGKDGSISPYEQGLSDLHNGLANANLDNGAQALKGLNSVYGNVVQGHVGSVLPDGTAATSAEHATPAVLPNGQLVPRVTYTGQTQDGRKVSTTEPMMAADGSGNVHTTTASAIQNNSQAKQALVNIANHPDVAQNLRKATNTAALQQHQEALQVAAAHPAHVAPATFMGSPIPPNALPSYQKAEDMVKGLAEGGMPAHIQAQEDKHGNFVSFRATTDPKAAPLLAFGVNPAQGALDQATLDEKHAQTASAWASANKTVTAAKHLADSSVSPDAIRYSKLASELGVPFGAGMRSLPKDVKTPMLNALGATISGLSDSQAQGLIARNRIGFKAAEKMLDPGTNVGQQVAAYPTLMQHFNLYEKYADALHNGNVKLASMVKNRIGQEFGSANAEGAQQMALYLGHEVARNLGAKSQAEQQKFAETFATNLSGSQYKTVIDNAKTAAAERLHALSQIAGPLGTHILSNYLTGDAKLYFDQTAPQKGLGGDQKSSATTPPVVPANVPRTNAQGWQLHEDKYGALAYVSPDGKHVVEYKQ